MKLKESVDSKTPEEMAPGYNSIKENNTTETNTITKESIKENSPETKQTSNSLFNHIEQENKIFTKKNSEGYIKLFYYYTKEEPMEIQLSEGDINEYEIHSIGGQKYYPLILGYEEAKTMREEGLFTNIGDPIKNFFGKNIVIVGVMNKTNSILDTVHLIPLTSEELN
ncbi:hypothetical protein J4218_01295 [Candidatus Pacearchaeota archaeon]|nr:hypothetical protein [Candidatus Pacearchaeota archaeon]